MTDVRSARLERVFMPLTARSSIHLHSQLIFDSPDHCLAESLDCRCNLITAPVPVSGIVYFLSSNPCAVFVANFFCSSQVSDTV